MAEPLRVLLVEDSDDDAALILRTLKKGGYDIEHLRVDTAEELETALKQQSWDLILSDYSMPHLNGMEALELVKGHGLEAPFILVSGAVGEETATEIMRRGARDYVMKDKLARLLPAVQRELAETFEKRHRLENEQKLQAQLHQAQKMEAIGNLAGGVAHDFNNLLTVIKGYAEIALLRIKQGEPGHGELEGILEATHRSTQLTRQLLAFARKQTANPQQLDLNQTVSGMLTMLRRLIGEDIELRWLPAPDLWPVRIDAGQVDQVLANLCVNARDAVGGGGLISIETTNVVLDQDYCAGHAEASPGDYVLLTVSDNGTGMSPAVQQHIFEPFFTTKEADKGTGLGLATIYGIVRQNEGFINFYSEPGRGTTFRIYLPRREQDQAQPVPASATPAEQPVGGRETILLVEDDEAILTVTSRILTGLGYQVLAASTPGRALELAAQHGGRIDLLLSDVVMPELNGQELARRVQASHPEIRCLFMSGYTADVVNGNGLLEEGNNFLAKPFSLPELAAKVRATLA